MAWRVVPAEFVTTDSGTGVVHQAPAFGEVDFEVLQSEIGRFEPGEGPELICAVAPDGRFTDEMPDYAGRWVKEADKDIRASCDNVGCCSTWINICTNTRSAGGPNRIR